MTGNIPENIDIHEKCKILNEKVSLGEISINEARKEFKLPPIEGGDVLITKVRSDKRMV